MKPEFSDIVGIMERSYQKNIGVYDEFFLLKTITKRVEVNSLPQIVDYTQLLSTSKIEAELLWASLTINYSIFFRNPLTFSYLAQSILPLILKKKNAQEEVRVWSAGCACGQEAYSLAILLDQLISDEEMRASIRIFATDINKDNLQAARDGVFDSSMIQNVNIKQFNQYFMQEENCFKVMPCLKNLIEFSTYDLLDHNSSSPPSSIYGDFDLIMCSNLIFYYTNDARQVILDKIYSSLTPNGFFVTGEVERAIVEQSHSFNEVAPNTAIYKKVTKR